VALREVTERLWNLFWQASQPKHEDILNILEKYFTTCEEFWRWQGDGEDHLESLVCSIVIKPEQLREIIYGAASDKPKLPVGVSVLLTNKEGQLLLGRRKPDAGNAVGLLSTPGGRIELLEDMFACARREFIEETGAILAGKLRVVGFKEMFRFGMHYIMFYIQATEYEGIITNKEETKCEGWDWYDIGNIDLNQCTEPVDILGKLDLGK
jgi:8-oxo-dGTP diphosphatase